MAFLTSFTLIFLSTPSARRATSTSVGCVTFWFLFLSTPSARRATYSIPGLIDHH